MICESSNGKLRSGCKPDLGVSIRQPTGVYTIWIITGTDLGGDADTCEPMWTAPPMDGNVHCWMERGRWTVMYFRPGIWSLQGSTKIILLRQAVANSLVFVFISTLCFSWWIVAAFCWHCHSSQPKPDPKTISSEQNVSLSSKSGPGKDCTQHGPVSRLAHRPFASPVIPTDRRRRKYPWTWLTKLP